MHTYVDIFVCVFARLSVCLCVRFVFCQAHGSEGEDKFQLDVYVEVQGFVVDIAL